MVTHKKTNKIVKSSHAFRHDFLNVRWLIIAITFMLLSTAALAWYNHPNLGPRLIAPPADALYKQKGAPINSRVNDLLSRMTLEEKIGQMSLVDKNSLKDIKDISTYNLGGILSGAGAKPKNNTPAGWLEMVSSMKQQATHSRLNIPILYGIDANHGNGNVLGATVFPHAIGMGASGDVNLVKNVAQATAEELQATGANWVYSPSLDAPKDTRWGRVYEAFSDDPALNGTLGAAFVAGMQTPTDSQTTIMATAKHYLATGAMLWGQSNHKVFMIDQGKTTANEQALTEQYLPPYKALVDAGVSSVMVGLNQWGDTRIIDSKYLITEKLKNQLGFKGFVVSDWYGTYEYSKTNAYYANIKTINAGLDMAMLPYNYKAYLKDVRKAVVKGAISQSRIDDAVYRILYQKFKAGLFDMPLNTGNLQNVGSEKHHLLARKAVAKSAVLLKNNGNLLPLSKNGGRILVAGSSADNVGRQCGAWTVEWQGVDGNWTPGGTSILQGIRQVAGTSKNIIYEKDALFTDVSVADVGIAVVGEKPYAEGWGDNPNPTLDAYDINVINKLRAHSKQLIIIVVSGRPLLMDEQIKKSDALIVAWLPGSEGAGIADDLFGVQPFSAKLPLPWPKSIEQLPINFKGSTNNATPLDYARGFGIFTSQ